MNTGISSTFGGVNDLRLRIQFPAYRRSRQPPPFLFEHALAGLGEGRNAPPRGAFSESGSPPDGDQPLVGEYLLAGLRERDQSGGAESEPWRCPRMTSPSI